ncbi:hypothetical protein EB796_024343 [Bugula neritina]|uniref:Uncharacterized protein n=1 Tax=Bugula neritina TaxID=10212 RepID=A0A7J7IVA6_BUGNE|nr:hypothetical protein EB796_024343 [Bugula neritina]
MPIDMVHKRLTDSLKKACSLIRPNGNAQGTEAASKFNSTFTLEKDNPETNPIIEAYMIGDENLNSSISLLEEQENLSKEKSMLYTQRAKLEQEKQNLTEAAISLHKERKKFDEYRKATMNGANTSCLLAVSPSPTKSPRRLTDHVEQIKLAVEEQVKKKDC